MEEVFNHFIHAVIIALIAFAIMRFIFRQSFNMSANRSLIIGSVALVYMIFFGHSLPFHLRRV